MKSEEKCHDLPKSKEAVPELYIDGLDDEQVREIQIKCIVNPLTTGFIHVLTTIVLLCKLQSSLDLLEPHLLIFWKEKFLFLLLMLLIILEQY